MNVHGSGATSVLPWSPMPGRDQHRPDRIGIVSLPDSALIMINGQQAGRVPMPNNVPGYTVGLECETSGTAPATCGFGNFVVKLAPANLAGEAPKG